MSSTEATSTDNFTENYTTTDSPYSKCDSSEYSCSTVALLTAVILLVLVLYVILALTRILLCFVYKRRQQNSATTERVNREIEEIGHPFSYLADRGFENEGFVEPPPTYEQLFKRDKPPPIYETPAGQRRPQPVQLSRQPSALSIISAPVSYPQPTFIPRSTSRSSLPIGVFGTSIPSITNMVIDESYRPRNAILGQSPDESYSRPNLLIPGEGEQPPPPVAAEEGGSPTREVLI